jgi:hypothetical protein
MNAQRIKLDTRRKVALAVSIILTLTIVFGGTFAWVSLNEQAINWAQGEPGPAGGRLHDDFEVVGANYGIDEWSDSLTANKDIYVENYESIADGGRPIFARLKLYEYMEIGAGATEPPTIADLANPGSYIANPAYINREAKPLIEGTNRDDVSTWSPRLPGANPVSDQFRAKWDWVQGGQKTYMPTFNKDNHSLETDIKGDAIDPAVLVAGEQMNTTKRTGSHEYLHVPDPANPGAPAAGEHDYFDTVTTWQAPEKYWDAEADNGAGGKGVHAIKGAGEESTHTAKPTVSGSVITMAQWMSAPYDGKPGDFWVVDTDGWCYWANPIKPETATGLLLDSITLQGSPDDEWRYGIYVKAEMATAGDWTAGAEGGGFYSNADEQPSPEAENLMNVITGRLPKAVGIYLDKSVAAVDVNGTLALNVVDVITENTNDPAWKAVTWSISPSVGTRFSSNGVFTPSGQDTGKWYTIRATSAKDPSVYAECKVYVPQANQSVLEGADGNVYLYHVDNNDNTYQQVKPDGTLGPLICPAEVGKPGVPSDRTVAVIGGGHYLDTGDGKHYYAAGPDALLGTSDDVLMYNENGVMKPDQNTIDIVINPAVLEVTRKQTLAMTAKATFEGAEVTNGVSWSLVGNYASGTSLAGTGANATLTVAAAESATTVVVRVYHPGTDGSGDAGAVGATNGVSRDIVVKIKSLVGAEYTDNKGVTWIILKEEGGYRLLTTKHVYGHGTLYNKTNTWNHLDTSGNNLKSALQTWYVNSAGTNIKSLAVPYVAPLPDVRSSVGNFNGG